MPGVGYLLVAELVGFSIFDASFASIPNVLNIGIQSATLVLLALPMTLIIMSEGLDLSMGAVLGLAGIVLATMLAHGSGLVVSLAGALVVGAGFGLANGMLVAKIGIPPFIATLGTLGIAQGLAVAALLLTGRMNAGHPIAAIGMEFDAIAAVIVGGTSFEHGNGWLPGTLLGVLAIGALKNGLNVMAVPSSLQSAGIGLLVIAALLVDSRREPR